MYAIGASVRRTTTDHRGTEWTTTRHLPTFYLDPNVQGILNHEQAERIARSILDPFGTFGDNLSILVIAP